MLSQSIQDYLKTIYKLEDGTPVSTTQIATEMQISGASVTGMLKRLSKLKLVDYNAYHGVKLTKHGLNSALAVIRKHRIIETYLKESLGYELQYIHDEACKLEHVVSDMFIDKIEDLLDNPTYSPMGKPIPTKDLKLPEQDLVPLSDVQPVAEVIVRSVDDSDKEILGYLAERGFLPGLTILVEHKEPFKGPITLVMGTKKTPDIIGYEIAKRLFVEVID